MQENSSSTYSTKACATTNSRSRSADETETLKPFCLCQTDPLGGSFKIREIHSMHLSEPNPCRILRLPESIVRRYRGHFINPEQHNTWLENDVTIPL